MPTEEQTRNGRDTQQEGDWTVVPNEVRVEARHAAYGGMLAAAVTLVGAWLVGQASGAEARALLETALPSTRSFCRTIILALGNILALMLTLLSLSSSADVDLKWAHYQRVKQIAWIVTVSLTGAILIYLVLNVPLTESQSGNMAGASTWFAVLYYATLVAASALGGALITVALMLYNTVRDVIRAVSSEKSSRLTHAEES